MRVVCAIILLFSLLVQTFSKTYTVIRYYTNTEDYARYCVNKARPQMRCNGQCQMMKELREKERKEHPYPGPRPNMSPEVMSTRSFPPEIPRQPLLAVVHNRFYGMRHFTSDFQGEIFHPPSITALCRFYM